MRAPQFVHRVSRTLDWIASLRGTVLIGGATLFALAFLTFPDPRIRELPWLAPVIAIACGFGGGIGLSAAVRVPTDTTRIIVGMCMTLAACLRATIFVYTSIRGGGFGTIVTVVPSVTMVFPFLLGVGLWRGAHHPAARPERLDRE
jgi:hypothetical protein